MSEESDAPVNTTRVDRKYIDTPGRVDEFVRETDQFDSP